ncbi:hypothetical protein [Cryobacterium sp. TMS1-13-1]|nr:hypothetical protein [Cryobacterium sp. TMS1-13-1]
MHQTGLNAYLDVYFQVGRCSVKAAQGLRWRSAHPHKPHADGL